MGRCCKSAPSVYPTETESEEQDETDKRFKRAGRKDWLSPSKIRPCLSRLITHSSYANEHRHEGLKDNERLEFLGDAVLEIISSEYLFYNYPDMAEGEMTKLRASIVCEPTLALCTHEISLGSYLFLGKGEERTGGRNRDSIVSDAMESCNRSYLSGWWFC